MIADDMTWQEIKRKVGEMASMENDLRQAQGSRDHWKDKCYRFAQDVGEHYTQLPIDAGGGTIRPGARVMHDGKTWAVRTLMLTDEGEWLLDCQPEDGEPPAGRTVKPELCIATYQRTVEDVLREFSCVLMGKREFDGDVTEAIAEYAAKLQLKEG